MSAKASQKKMEYIANYEADNYDKVLTRLPKGYKARIQATGATVNGFIVNAVKQALDGPQPVQEPPQPVATPATTIDITAFDNAVTVLLTPSMRRNMDAAINRNYAPNRIEYVYRAIDEQLQRDIDTENKKRSAVNAKAQAAYFRRMDIDMELEAMNNPPDDTPPDCV